MVKIYKKPSVITFTNQQVKDYMAAARSEYCTRGNQPGYCHTGHSQTGKSCGSAHAYG